MYDVKVTNNYMMTVKVNAAPAGGSPTARDIAPNGGQHSITRLGNMTMVIPGIGEAVFIDLAETKLNGYDKPAEYWGMIIRFKTKEIYCRYEGGGSMEVTIDHLGTMHVKMINGSAIVIRLPEMTLT